LGGCAAGLAWAAAEAGRLVREAGAVVDDAEDDTVR
jgi:hypothetical protein